MIGRAGQWTRIPSTTCLQPKNEMLIFGLRSTSGDQPGWLMDLNPICHPSPTKKMKCLLLYYVIVQIISRAGRWTQSPSTTPQAKKWNANFCITFNFWWLAGLVDGLEPHPLPFSSQKNEMLIFVLHSTSDNWPGWSLDSNPIHLLSQAKKNEMLIFGLRLTSDDQPGWLMNLNPICHPSPARKMKCSFIDYVQLLMIGRAGQWTRIPSATCLQPKNEMLILDYVQLLMISWAGQWTRIPSATPLQTKKWYAHFWITFNFWWLARLVNGLEPYLPSLSKQKNDMLIFVLHSSSDHWLGWSMDLNPICNLSPAKKVKCSFLDYVQLLMIGRADQWTQTPSATSLQA